MLYRYKWEFNGKPFDPAGTDDDVVQLAGTGTLVFARPGTQYAGFYKCFATNDFGVAVGDVVQLINASKLKQSHIYDLNFHFRITCIL